MDVPVSPLDLGSLAAREPVPQVLDVRRNAAFEDAEDGLPGAIRREPATLTDWARELEVHRPVAVYCVHGHEVSRGVAAELRARGLPARHLAGGIEGWREAGLPLAAKPSAPSIWVTGERPKIDRVACLWLVRRFVDSGARFVYVPVGEVVEAARRIGGTPYDVPGVEFGHVGERCSFDAFVERFRLTDPALLAMAPIVRGADTSRHDLAPEAAGLLAVSLGLSALFADDDYAVLRQGMAVYDALHRRARDRRAETHGWPPRAA
jgi:rhodanese-related sulfurtransferase